MPTEEQSNALSRFRGATDDIARLIYSLIDKIDNNLVPAAEDVADAINDRDAKVLLLQIDAYLRPHLMDWIQSEHQCGSLASMKKICDSLETMLQERENEGD